MPEQLVVLLSQLYQKLQPKYMYARFLLLFSTDELTKSSEKTVHFSIQEGPHKNFMWKVSTKIVCEKVRYVVWIIKNYGQAFKQIRYGSVTGSEDISI